MGGVCGKHCGSFGVLGRYHLTPALPANGRRKIQDCMEGGGDLGGDAEPGGEAGDGLVEEHAQAGDCAQAAGAGLGEEGGVGRRVDNVGDGEGGGSAGEVDVQGRLAFHAEGGGVHEEGLVGQGVGAAVPVEQGDFGERVLEGAGAVFGAVGDGDVNARFEERGGDGAGGAAGPKQKGGACRRRDLVGGEVAEEAGAVGVAADGQAVLEDDGVDGAGAAGAVLDLVANVKGGLLVGDGDV